jgi:monofunctional biosynthetic peptidoglycan transglycosylase
MFMLLERASAWTQGNRHYAIDYEWVPWSAISPQIKLAVVAAEDQNFIEHHGFDFNAMGKALEHNIEGHATRGGSTITQQTAKNLFLYPGRSYLRKILEAYFTLLIELSWPKRRILEVYLNIAEFGEGVYGVGAAARTFLGKPAARIERQEAARLAAVLPNPKRLTMDQPSTYVLKRQQWIVGQMRALGERRLLEAF